MAFRSVLTKLFILFFIFPIVISCSNTNKIITETATVPTVTLDGKAVDQESGEPIAGGLILLSGTTQQTQTDSEGGFTIKLPAGYYEVFVDHKDYRGGSEEVNLIRSNGARQSVTLQAERIPSFLDRKENPSLNASLSQSKIDEHPQSKRLKTFIDYYITDDDLKCGLANPDDVTFAKGNEDGVTWVREPAELVVLNYELGYKVRIALEEYVAKEYSQIIGQNVDADYFFEELEPINEVQKREWKEKREEFFQGSFRHFLIAMASDKSPLSFGYRIFSGQAVTSTSAMAFSSSSVSDIEKEKGEIIIPSFENENLLIRSEEEIRIEYIEKGVDDPDGIMGLQNYRHQTSWISLNGWSAEFTRNGLLKAKDAVEIKGYWRYVPVCKMLPDDYLPVIEDKENS
ncbi:MAG TPA: hypothetical protein DD671_05650 [Balneolaceae bacterium]|nr:hypothetical protein [Balneolaceae bacterium]